MRIMNIVSSCACCWSALFQLGVFFCAVHSQGPLSSLHHPLSPFHLLHVLLTPPAALHPFVGSESTQESPNKLDKTSPGADRRAVMIYANLTNRHLGTMVISTVKGGKKKKNTFSYLFFSVNWLQSMHFEYAHIIWTGNGLAEIPSHHLPFHFLRLRKSLVCVWTDVCWAQREDYSNNWLLQATSL